MSVRYWPGKAPEWANEAAAAAAAADLDIKKPYEHQEGSHHFLNMDDDRRLRRLAESSGEALNRARAEHRRIRQAEILFTIEEEVEDEDEDVVVERRLRVRQKLLKREQKEIALLPGEPAEELEEEASEYETDSEEEEQMRIHKPVFIPESRRDTIAEPELLKEEEHRLEQLATKRREDRRVETKLMVVEEIRKNQEMHENLETEADVDMDDELHEEEEYGAWRTREIARIKRAREDPDMRLMEKEEMKREWERNNPMILPPRKQKRSLMQRCGTTRATFFQSEDGDIYCQDFSAPTGEDNMNMTILPKLMQVKRFGRSTRAKWTHLVDEDTTDRNSPWNANGPLRAK